MLHQDVSPWRFTVSVDGVGISHQRSWEFSGNVDSWELPAGLRTHRGLSALMSLIICTFFLGKKKKKTGQEGWKI